MKKLLVIVAVALVACSFSSCKKTCYCTVTVAGISQDMDPVTLEKNSPYKNCKELQELLNADVTGIAEVKCK